MAGNAVTNPTTVTVEELKNTKLNDITMPISSENVLTAEERKTFDYRRTRDSYTAVEYISKEIGIEKMMLAAARNEIDRNQIIHVVCEGLSHIADCEINHNRITNRKFETDRSTWPQSLSTQINSLAALKELSPLPAKAAYYILDRITERMHPTLLSLCLPHEELTGLLKSMGAEAVPALMEGLIRNPNDSTCRKILVDMAKTGDPNIDSAIIKNLRENEIGKPVDSDHIYLLSILRNESYNITEVVEPVLKNILGNKLPDVVEMVPAIISLPAYEFAEIQSIYLAKHGVEAANILTSTLNEISREKYKGDADAHSVLTAIELLPPELKNEALLKQAISKNSTVRENAFRALASQFGDKESVITNKFINALNDRSESVRRVAINVMERIEDIDLARKAVPALLKEFNNPTSSIAIREQAFNALLQLRELSGIAKPRVVVFISNLFKFDPLTQIVPNAIASLKPSAIPEELQTKIPHKLAYSGKLDSRIAPALVKIFSDYPEPERQNSHESLMRAHATTGLTQIGGKALLKAAPLINAFRAKFESMRDDGISIPWPNF